MQKVEKQKSGKVESKIEEKKKSRNIIENSTFFCKFLLALATMFSTKFILSPKTIFSPKTMFSPKQKKLIDLRGYTRSSLVLVTYYFVTMFAKQPGCIVFVKGTVTLFIKSSNVEYFGKNKVSCTIAMTSKWILITLWCVLRILDYFRNWELIAHSLVGLEDSIEPKYGAFYSNNTDSNHTLSLVLFYLFN